MNKEKKYLVVKLRTLGDTVMSTAFVSQLKQLEPACQIDFVCTNTWAPVLQNHPDIQNVIALNFSKKDPFRFFKILRLAWKLRREKYNAAFGLHASSSSAWLILLSGIKTRVIHNHHFQGSKLFSTVEIPNSDKLHPALTRDSLCLNAVGLTPKNPLKTSAYINSLESHWAEAYLKKKQLKQPLLVLGLTASRETKMWPQENFAILANRWIQEKKASVLALHAPNEKKYADNFKAALYPLGIASNVCIESDLSIREMMALISKATLFIGNDSGPKHLAVALNIPSITFFGPEDPFEYHPYETNMHKIKFIENLNCRTNLSPQGDHPWCGIHVCDKEDLKCLKSINPDSIEF